MPPDLRPKVASGRHRATPAPIFLGGSLTRCRTGERRQDGPRPRRRPHGHRPDPAAGGFRRTEVRSAAPQDPCFQTRRGRVRRRRQRPWPCGRPSPTWAQEHTHARNTTHTRERRLPTATVSHTARAGGILRRRRGERRRKGGARDARVCSPPVSLSLERRGGRSGFTRTLLCGYTCKVWSFWVIDIIINVKRNNTIMAQCHCHGTVSIVLHWLVTQERYLQIPHHIL
jgi:hypothetical protein